MSEKNDEIQGWEKAKDKQECVICHKHIVHPDRRYSICLDCLIDELEKSGANLNTLGWRRST